MLRAELVRLPPPKDIQPKPKPIGFYAVSRLVRRLQQEGISKNRRLEWLRNYRDANREDMNEDALKTIEIFLGR